MFRSLLVENPLRFVFNPALGALGGLCGWALFILTLASVETLTGETSDLVERTAYFAFMGLAVGFACNLLRGIQDGQGALRVVSQGMVSGAVGGLGGLLGGLAVHVLAELMGSSLEAVLPRLATYLVVGTLVGLSSRITTFDRFTLLSALGGFLGALLAVLVWVTLEQMGDAAESYAGFLVPMALGFGIGAATYSLPSFVSGATLRVMTGQFRGQSKGLEAEDIIVGNNKRQLQWVLPKWEGVQDPHARVEVIADGRGFRHVVYNLSAKTLVVVREHKKHRVRGKQGLDLQHDDVLVFATGRNFVKVRYTQRTVRGNS